MEERPKEYIYDENVDKAFVPADPVDEFAQFHRYRTREVIEAMRFDPTRPADQWPNGVRLRSIRTMSSTPVPAVLSMDGWQVVSHGDYVVRDNGRIYVMEADLFHTQFELVGAPVMNTVELEAYEAEEEAAMQEYLKDLMEKPDDPDAPIDVQEKDFAILKQLVAATPERDLLNKPGRDRLVAMGYVQTVSGWSYLTAEGIKLCIRLRFLRS